MILSNPTPRLDSPPEVQKPGALVLSDSLAKACSFDLRCAGASIGLRLISDIFSSSTMTQTYKQKINVEAVEIYKNKQVLMQPMLTTFE